MLSENQNNFHSWRNKLEVLDSLPEESFQSSVAWEKLHARLQQKPKSKKVVIYWLAAACFLGLILFSWLLVDTKSISVVKKSITPKPFLKTTHNPESTLVEAVTAKTVNFSKNQKKHDKRLIAEADKTPAPSSIITTAEEDVLTTRAASPNIALEEISPVAADTIHPLITKVNSRPKLQVVHINELGQPVNETKFARNEGNIFPVRITNKDSFSGSSSRPNADHSILKINLSRQN